jgi:hypothetical protein
MLSRMDVLRELAGVKTARAALDARERQLIEAAREAELGWAAIAEALGLKSRQAAEQRLLRLNAASGRDPQAARREQKYQRSVDDEPMKALRKAVRKAYVDIATQSTWDESHPRASLARHALEGAAAASPGSLYALTGKAIDDLEAMRSGLAASLREAFSAATPGRDAASRESRSA